MSATADGTVSSGFALAADESTRTVDLERLQQILLDGALSFERACTSESTLEHFLLSSVAVTEGSGGAILRRIRETEHEFAAVVRQNSIIPPSVWASQDSLAEVRYVTALDAAGVVGRLVRGEEQWIPVDQELERWAPGAAAYHQQQGNQAFFACPFYVEGEMAGYLAIAFPHRVPPSSSQRETLRALSRQASVALALHLVAARLKDTPSMRALQRAEQVRAEELAKANQALKRSSERLVKLEDLDEFLYELLESAMEASGAACGGIGLVTSDRKLLEFVALLDDSGPGGSLRRLATPLRSVVLEGAARKAWEEIEQAPGYWWASPDHPGFTPENRAYHIARGHQQIAHVRIGLRGEAIGLLAFGFRNAERPTATRLEMLGVLAQQASLAIGLTRLGKQASETAAAAERERAAEARAAGLEKANSALRSAITSLAETECLEDFLAEMLSASLNIAGAQNGAVILIRGDEAEIVVAIERGRRISRCEQELAGAYRVPITSSQRAYLELARNCGDLWVPPPDAESATFAFTTHHQRTENKALRNLPLAVRGKIIGWLRFGFAEAAPSACDRKETLQTLAEQMTLAVQMARLADENREALLLREREKASQAVNVAVAQEKEIAIAERATELARFNEAIRSTLAELTEQPALEHFLGRVLGGIVKQLGALGAELWVYEPQQDRIQLRLAFFDGKPTRHPGPLGQCQFCTDYCFRLMEPAHTIAGGYRFDHFRDLMQSLDSNALQWYTRQGVRGVLRVPVAVGKKAIGNIAVWKADVMPFEDGQVQLAISLAQQAALAIHTAHLAEDAKDAAIARERETAAQDKALELARATEIMKRTSRGLLGASAPDAVLPNILSEACRALGAVDGLLFTYREEEQTLAIVCGVRDGVAGTSLPGYPYGDPDKPLPIHALERWSELVHSGRPVFVSGPDQWLVADTRQWHELREHQLGVMSALVMDGTPLGCLGLVFRERTEFSAIELEMYNILAQQAALALQMAKLSKDAGSQAEKRAVLEERNRMAREIHDTLAQGFTGVLMQLQALEQSLDDNNTDGVATHLSNAASIARSALTEARRSVRALRPVQIDKGSLSEALRLAAELAAQQFGIPVSMDCPDELDFDPDTSSEVLRIAQEAMTNAIKHSQASRIQIGCNGNTDRRILWISDDGTGFDPTKKTEGFGVVGMRERAERVGAKLFIDSGSGGTVVSIVFNSGINNE